MPGDPVADMVAEPGWVPRGPVHVSETPPMVLSSVTTALIGVLVWPLVGLQDSPAGGRKGATVGARSTRAVNDTVPPPWASLVIRNEWA